MCFFLRQLGKSYLYKYSCNNQLTRELRFHMYVTAHIPILYNYTNNPRRVTLKEKSETKINLYQRRLYIREKVSNEQAMLL